MQRHPDSDSRPSRVRDQTEVVARSEDLHIRNYDPHKAYDLTVSVEDPAGRTVFEERYYLQPGQRRSEKRILDRGTHEVTVTLDNVRKRSIEAEVGPDPERTVLIEVGNDTVSVTQGLYS